MTNLKPKIGIFGGSGFYELFDSAEEIEVCTDFGNPSDKITVGTISGKPVAFLPRHGKGHKFSAHAIPYRANLAAMKKIGVEQILSPCAAGSLQRHIKPGEFVICDQFIDRTKHREETYYPGPKIIHVSPADPYCPSLRQNIIEAGKKIDVKIHDRGEVVIIEGPRFSTKAESKWYSKMGWEVINMTQYPEVILARELEICYANISLITDYDAGLFADNPDEKPVEAAEVGKIFANNINNVKKLLYETIPLIKTERTCDCKNALKNAEL